MFEIQKTTDYGAYSYNHETGGKNRDKDVAFGDVMAGSGEMSEMREPAYMDIKRDFGLPASPVIEVVTYNHGGKSLIMESFIGINLDITA